MPQRATIGKWFDSNKHNYFAKPEIEYREIETNSNFADKWGLTLQSGLLSYPSKKERVIIGVQPTTEMPFAFITIQTRRKFPNITDYGFIILPFISKTEVKIFTTQLEYADKGWNDSFVSNKSIEWNHSNYFLKDEEKIHIFINSLFDQFCLNIKNNIEKLFIEPDNKAIESEN